jgi:hypothetical protein
MEFDLKEIGVTIFIGAYFLFGIEVLLYLFFSSNLFLTIERETRFTSRSLIVLALTLCFAFGMLIEDVSNKFVDEDEQLQKYVVSIFPPHSSDDQIKFRTLFGETGSSPSNFALEMSRFGLVSTYGGKHGHDVQEAINQHGNTQQIERVKLMSVAKELYYNAKNRVYREQTYYDELKEIQLRIDFARSYLTISFLLIPIALLVAVISLFITKRVGQEATGKPREAQKDRRLVFFRAAACTLLFLIGSCLLGKYAFVSEESEFDKRAYGYFYSIMNAPTDPQTPSSKIESASSGSH